MGCFGEEGRRKWFGSCGGSFGDGFRCYGLVVIFGHFGYASVNILILNL